MIALVTFSPYPDLIYGDALLPPALDGLGLQWQAIPWDADVDWSQYDALVLRSTWDYFLRYAEFSSWLEHIEGLNVWNPLPLVRWNSDKRYLEQLAAQGIRIPPTRFVQELTDLRTIQAEENWEQVVVKPCISGGAMGMFLSSDDAAHDQVQFEALLQSSAAMVQPLLQEIQNGEYSFIFFRAAEISFSHAVIKRPKSDDIRVQTEFGGITKQVAPAPTLLAQARAILDVIESDWLYARVDGIVMEGQFTLMELEMIEPELFFDHDDAAPLRFAQALQARL